MREMQEADFNFNPRSPHGERRGKARRDHRGGNFNPRSPHGERRASVRVTSVPMISIHAPRTGSDCESGAVYCPEHIFQSTLPARGATDLYPRRRHDRRYFNPRSPHGERRRLHHGRRWHDHISIHAPRTGSDTGGDPFFYDSWDISIHAPRTGSDVCFFQDTPLRRLISIHAPRTGSDCAKRQSRHAFGISIHAPRTGSDHLPLLASPAGDISIHAPRTGSDPSPSGRLSRRMSISIHAPRTGSDVPAAVILADIRLFQSTLPARGATYQRPSSLRTSGYFNPRSPHGERRAPATSGRPREPFQSTLPARGATGCSPGQMPGLIFQSTLPARGATRQRRRNDGGKQGFQSTLPARGATQMLCGLKITGIFQSTLPARGATPAMLSARPRAAFQSTLPARGATLFALSSTLRCDNFNPRSPHGERHGRTGRRTIQPGISIHAPRTGSDGSRGTQRPRVPISIHAPRTGSDAGIAQNGGIPVISIHAPRTGSDVFADAHGRITAHFNPRSPHGERPSSSSQSFRIPSNFNPRSPHGERRREQTAF